MPIDNVQKFERLCSDANYIQVLADKGVDFEEVNGLTDMLRSDIQYGLHVCITGGLIEVSSYDENLTSTTEFVPLEDGVSGKYLGLSWKPEEIEFPDGSTDVTWRLCHDVGGEEGVYIDQHGDRIRRTPIAYVTVEGSEIELMSTIGSHDYRALESDGVCLLLDQLALDFKQDLNSKAQRIAKFFRISSTGDINPEKAKIIRQRISYLNELGLFETALVSTPIAVRRTHEGAEMLKTVGANLVASVIYLSTDQAVTVDGEWVDDTAVLSYEINTEEFGHLSIPHIPDVTKLYNLKQ